MCCRVALKQGLWHLGIWPGWIGQTESTNLFYDAERKQGAQSITTSGSFILSHVTMSHLWLAVQSKQAEHIA